MPAAEVEPSDGPTSLPEAFIFALGTLEPRKNLVDCCTLMRVSRGHDRRCTSPVAAGWRVSPIFDTVQQLDLDEHVHFLGFVPEDELPLWYNAARLFAFPSLYEGFGLPVLEAMACGTPGDHVERRVAA